MNTPKSSGENICQGLNQDDQYSETGKLLDLLKVENSKFPIVGIGASAGGISALEAFFTNMPPDAGMAFVVVMHLDPNNRDMLPEVLQRFTQMEVFQAQNGMHVEPNRVYVIPPNREMLLEHGNLVIRETARRMETRLLIDKFLESLAKDQRDKAICILLSGMGTDGTQGLKMIMENFGLVMVQDPETAEFTGMLESAIKTEFVDYILPPGQMPRQLISYVHFPANRRPQELAVETKPTHTLQKILYLIRQQTGHDFSLYKRNTVFRRIERRMNNHQLLQMSQYLRYLQENPLEVETLFRELLIGVTWFFRDQEAFELLQKVYLPEMLKTKEEGGTIRVWVAGCSTGEEAYSIAILVHECLEEMKNGNTFKVQVFATDIDPDAIEQARAGVYPENIAADVSEERLRRFFNKVNNNYSIKREIRESVVFAVHNLTKDAPFTKLDMLCCRNLLIYLSAELQRKIIPVFHYALKPGGLIFLGSSESISGYHELFTPLDTKWKISRRTESIYPLSRIVDFPISHTHVLPPKNGNVTAMKTTRELSIPSLVQKVLLDQYAPPSVIANQKGEIFYINGRTGKYLEPAPGQASMNVFDMAREGLKYELNNTIFKATSQQDVVVAEPVMVKNESGEQPIRLTVKLLSEPDVLRGLLLIVFEDIDLAAENEKQPSKRQSANVRNQVAELEKELHYTKQRLQTTIEEMQSSLEELKSTNEELQSANEELQSTNEESMMNKEEMQSLNEELMTINMQFQSKTEELSRSNNDMKNLLDSTEIGTIFLDNDLRIKNFTPQVTQIFNVIRSDIGRPVTDISSNLNYHNLVQDETEVLDKLISKEIDVPTTDGEHLYSMRILPYRTASNFIDGAVITFTNITKFKVLEQELEAMRIFAENVVSIVRDPLVVLDGNLRVISVSRSFVETFRVIEEQTRGQLLYNLGNGEWNIVQLHNLIEEVSLQNREVTDCLIEHQFPTIGTRRLLIDARKRENPVNQSAMIFLTIRDVTNQ